MRSYEYEYIVLNEEMTGSEDYEELSMKICVYRLSKENLLNSRQGYNRIAGNPGTSCDDGNRGSNKRFLL